MTSIVLLLLAIHAPKAVHCADGSDVTPVKAKAQLESVRKQMAKRGLHITDLPSDGQSARREVDTDMAGGEWCGVAQQTQVIKDALARTTVDQRLVSAKVDRAEMFAKSRRGPQRAKALQAIAKASQENEKGHTVKANTLANAALIGAMGTKDLWTLPKLKSGDPEAPAAKPGAENARTAAELDADEVKLGCPMVDGASGHGLSAEQATDRLRTTLDQLQVRIIDIKRGPELAAALDKELIARNSANAVKLACVLNYRASSVSDSLDRVAARFQRVNMLRDSRGVSAAEKPVFDSLVTDASTHLAKRDFAGARATLERLFVLLGDPVTPGAQIPRP